MGLPGRPGEKGRGLTSPYLQRRLRSLDEVREQRDFVCVDASAAMRDSSHETLLHEANTVRPPARRGRARRIVLFAITFGVVVALLALALGKPRSIPDSDMSLEAEQMNTLSPAAGPAELPSGGTDSFVNPGRSVTPPQLGPADTLEPSQPRFR